MADPCSFDSSTAIRLWNDEHAGEPHGLCRYAIPTSSRLQPVAIHRCPAGQSRDRAGNRARSRVIPGTLFRSAQPRHSARPILDTPNPDSHSARPNTHPIINSDSWSEPDIYTKPYGNVVADGNGDPDEYLYPNSYCDSIRHSHALWSTTAHRPCQPSSEYILVLESNKSLYLHDAPQFAQWYISR